MNALEYAIRMEVDGEKYYSEQAGLNKNTRIEVVCNILEKAERSHEQLLKDKLNGLSHTLPESESYADMKNVFQGADNFKSDIKANPTQLEFYRVALEFEQKSIDLYKDLLSKASGQDEQELFNFLVEQEKQHFLFLDELVNELRHAEEWVEDAEFGLRNEIY